MSILEKLSLAGLVPVIKVEDAADAVPLCKALSDGGLPVAEITFRTAAAEEAIRRVKNELPDVMLGAGTVLTIEQVRKAVDAGAAYIVSPGLNPKVVEYCVSNNIPILPGCSCPSDVEAALSFGITTVKFFPAEAAGGIKFIKAISAPYGAVRFVPTGGIGENNLKDYITFPKVAAVGGSWMVPADAIKAKDWNRITALTRSAVKLMLGTELKKVVLACCAEAAEKQLKKLSLLTGLSAEGMVIGNKYEISTDGKNALVFGVNSIARAKWHFEAMGFSFKEGSDTVLADEICGFEIRIAAN